MVIFCQVDPNACINKKFQHIFVSPFGPQAVRCTGLIVRNRVRCFTLNTDNCSNAEFALKGVEVGTDLLDKSKNAKDNEPAAFGSMLFGSADFIRKINTKGVGIAVKDKDEKTRKPVEAGNKLLDKAVGFLRTLVNKTPPAFAL